jgi:uncharacterized protein (DUF305 family)
MHHTGPHTGRGQEAECQLEPAVGPPSTESTRSAASLLGIGRPFAAPSATRRHSSRPPQEKRDVRPIHATILTVALALAACSRPSGAPFDQQFVDMMVPHHQGAVEMAMIAQQRAEHAEIKRMADDIIRSQSTEIDQMKAWRKQWFGSDQTPPMDKMPMVEGMGSMAGHGGMSGGTMDMAADVDKLRRAPEPFDRAFVDAMVPHHQSAIDAARAAETRAQKPEIKKLAQEIVAAQQKEIDQMQQWRRAWYGA